MWGMPDNASEKKNDSKPAKKNWGSSGSTGWGKSKTVEPAPKSSPKAQKTSKASFRGDKWFLSNMYPCPVKYQGVEYSCSEIAFQAQKCADDTERQKLIAIGDPFEVKKAAYKVKKRDDWQEVKVGIMREIVFAKFTQNPDLAEKLLATGDELLAEENNWNDRFWGVVDGEGENHLGKILMEVRESIRTATAEFGALPVQEEEPAPKPEPKKTSWGASASPQTASEPKKVQTGTWGRRNASASAQTPQSVSEDVENITIDGYADSKELIRAIARGNTVTTELSEENFAAMKNLCLRIAQGKAPQISFRALKPAEYKYFSELLYLYRRYTNKQINKEDAEKEERKLHKQYEEDVENEVKYYENIRRWTKDIRLSEMCRSSMNKCGDKDIALDLALQAISAMTGDTTVMTVTREKFLAGKPRAVTYDVSATYYKEETNPEEGQE